MAEILDVVDLEALRKEVREKYREVAEDPTAEYHFHTGRPHAIRLGYPAAPLDQLPDYACEAFAGVGNPFFWGGPKPGERVVDLGSGAGLEDIELANPLDTFAGARGEESAREFGTLGYSIRARKPL